MTFGGILEVAFRNECLFNLIPWLIKFKESELYLTGGCIRADNLLVHTSAAHKHKMLCFTRCCDFFLVGISNLRVRSECLLLKLICERNPQIHPFLESLYILSFRFSYCYAMHMMN